MKTHHVSAPIPFSTSTRRQRGFTIIELAVVLAVALIIIGFAAARGGSLFGTNDVTNELSNLNMLLTNVKSIKGTGSYGAAGTSLVDTLSKTNNVPKNMAVSGATLTNAWGGGVTIVSTGPGVSINYPQVPRDACIKMIQNESKSGTYYSVQTNSGSVRTGEVLPVDATNDCSSTTANSITWITIS